MVAVGPGYRTMQMVPFRADFEFGAADRITAKFSILKLHHVREIFDLSKQIRNGVCLTLDLLLHALSLVPHVFYFPLGLSSGQCFQSQLVPLLALQCSA